MEMAMNDGEKRQSVGRIKNRGAGAPRSQKIKKPIAKKVNPYLD